jgi:hypothetical protein
MKPTPDVLLGSHIIRRELTAITEQNLDYMQEFLNGWLQGKEGWKLGTIKNRLECGA